MKWILEEWRLLLPLALGWLAVWRMLPRDKSRSRILGGIAGVIALVMLQGLLPAPTGPLIQSGVYFACAALAVVSGVLMISDRDPINAALWFALATLAVCGIFMLNSAPFLAAATVVVYAGAIVVTFLFVIMLAQQAGAAGYDRRAAQPLLATVFGFVLLAGLMLVLRDWKALKSADGETASAVVQFLPTPEGIDANPLSRPVNGDLGTLQGVGRSLFGDYLYAVELAGTILLIATIGAIALAPRRAQGTL